ncbi:MULTISPECIES: hypothetical protein [Clostridia]|uniref:hypothetical protein n=1 Tax=Clostridia TaxID=186801 RepID=UPI000EA28089|nr:MULTISPECIES: hypothetical protein [Clostridia]NBJ68880.1 hypothetical protein [Roseburia sp. 1XD42-34]RKI80254.1 hypothetical protein D7V87_05230 [Clostridium sp. 1xD42-85]
MNEIDKAVATELLKLSKEVLAEADLVHYPDNRTYESGIAEGKWMAFKKVHEIIIERVRELSSPKEKDTSANVSVE